MKLTAALIALLLVLHPTVAWCQTKATADDDVPVLPKAPPKLFLRNAPESFRCQRLFTYQGKVLGCDSYVRADGEGLRPLLKDIPAANSELNVYQQNKSSLQMTAYTGTLGLAMLLVSYFGRTFGGLELQYSQKLNIGGFAILGGSLVYGLTSTKANERHLDEAIRLHNQAKPDRPIELQFSTGLGF